MYTRKRMVRKLNSTTGTKYEIRGFFLSEKMKKALRNKIGKSEEKTWADVFPNADVVYRFNPTKGKLDVFVGQVEAARYASGKKRNLLPVDYSYLDDLDVISFNVPDHALSNSYVYTVSADSVKRGQ